MSETHCPDCLDSPCTCPTPGGGPMPGSTNWNQSPILKTMGSEEDKAEVEEMNKRISERGEDYIKIDFKFTSTDRHENEQRAIRLLKVDRAYSVLWDIDQELRSLIKYKYDNEDSWETEEIIKDLEDLRDRLYNSGLMEAYT